jgi:hypothetical protein
LAALLGFTPQVAKRRDPLLERADRAINEVDTLRVHVVTKDELAARRRKARMASLDLQAEVQQRQR